METEDGRGARRNTDYNLWWWYGGGGGEDLTRVSIATMTMIKIP